jgi:hypothetical protein
MNDPWEKFWSFIGVAFWVVFLGWIGISAFSPTDSASSSDESTYSDSSDIEDYSSSYDEPDYEEVPEPTSYRSSYSSSYDMDCSDFDSWEDAQYHYENVSDDNLDRDDDGVACESLQ